mgnify:FL=1
MPSFGKSSREKLSQCDHKLQEVFNEVIKHIDCSVLEGIRSKDKQDRMFAEGKSKFKYPGSKHNVTSANGKSIAVDVTPYPVNWKDRERQTLFAGFVIGIAKGMDIKIRWGGDWDMDWEVNDNKFDDFPHFELR